MRHNYIAVPILAFLIGSGAAAAGENADARFKISITGGFDYSVSTIDASSSLITDQDGEVMSDLVADKDDLRTLNRNNDYKLEQQFMDLRAEYSFITGASVWVGVGVVTTSMRNSYSETDELQTKSASENPTFLLKGGVNYTYTFAGGTFLTLAPSVAWNKSDNNLLSFSQDDRTAIYHGYGLSRDVFRWDIPLYAGHTFGKWTPFVGIAYTDYRIKDRFDSTVSYVGEDFPITIEETYRSRSKINGIAGCRFAIADNLGVKLEGRFSRNIAAQLSFYFTL